MWSSSLWDVWDRVQIGLGWATKAVWGALMCLVMGPAALVVSIWLLTVAFGVTSTQGLVKDLYTYADTSFRAAPTGMIRVQTCDDVLPAAPPSAPPLRDRYGDLPGCKHPRMINAPAAEVVADQTERLESLYWVLVGISTLYMFAFYFAKHRRSIGEHGNELIDRMIGLARH